MDADRLLERSAGAGVFKLPFYRHPELVSGPIVLQARSLRQMRGGAGQLHHGASVRAEKWVLKQVQDDEIVEKQVSAK